MSDFANYIMIVALVRDFPEMEVLSRRAWLAWIAARPFCSSSFERQVEELANMLFIRSLLVAMANSAVKTLTATDGFAPELCGCDCNYQQPGGFALLLFFRRHFQAGLPIMLGSTVI